MTNRRTPVSPNDPADGITHEVVTVTPAMAGDWLAANNHNRHLRYRVVTAYARDMAEGKWALNGEAVKFAADGTLLDGQHRLHAVVKADTPVKLLIVHNVPKSAQDTMDSGVNRKFADQLSLNGEGSPQILAAILRKVTLWEIGVYTKTSTLKPTFAEMADTLVRNPRVRDCANYGTKRAVASNLHASTIGFAYWLLSGLDHEEAAWFLDRVSDGVGLEAGHPALVLRERISRERNMTNGKVDPDVILALLIYAWNAHRNGRRIQKLQLPKDGLTNDTFPYPK